jgi:hypothetical protein
MKGNCFIDIDGIYEYHCLQTFFSYQSIKIIGLLKVCFLLRFIGWNPSISIKQLPFILTELEPSWSYGS